MPIRTRFHLDDVLEAVREFANTEPKTVACRCGCNAVVAYACDGHVLWVCSQLQPENAQSLKLVGLEHAPDVCDFIAQCRENGANADYLEELRVQLHGCCPTHGATLQ